MTVQTADLTARFEAARPQLGAIAYRMLGSIDDAQDAVQEAWLRLSRRQPAGAAEIANLDAWLTTVVARICLNTLRSRRARPREELVAHLPDPIVDAVGESDPEHRAMLADAVGLALFVVLDTLPPAERLAFVLHDVFTVPFDQIAPIVERTPEATRKLASRARRRIQQAAPHPGRRHRRAARGRRRILRRRTQRRLRPAGVGAAPRRGVARRLRPRPGRTALGARRRRGGQAGPELRGAGTRGARRHRQRRGRRGHLRRGRADRDHGLRGSRRTYRRDRRAGRPGTHRADRLARSVPASPSLPAAARARTGARSPSHLD